MTMKQFYEEINFVCEDILEARYRYTNNPCLNVSQKIAEYSMPGSCLSVQDNGLLIWPGVKYGGVELYVHEPRGPHMSFIQI